MNQVLVSAGAAAIIIAVVGGGAKAFGVEVPVLNSRPRQVVLALVGLAFLAAAVALRDGGSDGRPSEEVEAYRQDVLATCRSLQQDAGLPPLDQGGTIERAAFLEWLNAQLESSESVLAELWDRPVPDQLEERAAEARRDADAAAGQTRTAVARVGSRLPPSLDIQGVFAALQQLGAATRQGAARFEASMSRLAGRPCRPAVAGSEGGG